MSFQSTPLAGDKVYTNVHANDPFQSPIPKSVLIVGGGPAGLVTLRNLLEQRKFDKVQVVERRSDIGGVWNVESEATEHECLQQRPRWPSPAYNGMIGNVLPKFLSFSRSPFPPPPGTEEGQPFPNIGETFSYLKGFAGPHLQAGHIRLNTEVVRVEERGWGEGWKVIFRDWSTHGRVREVEEVWDAVVVAIHWHDNAEWPDTPGLDGLRAVGLAKHAKSWEGPEGHEGKRCLVIGNANSANDIAAHLAPAAATPVYQSIRRPAYPGFPGLPDERIQMVSPVAKYVLHGPEGCLKDVNDGAVVPSQFSAHLHDGTILEDMDIVHLGTGYYPFPDFVKVFKRPQLHSKPGYGYRVDPPMDIAVDSSKRTHVPIVVADTFPRRIPHLHRLSIYAPNPSLAFVGSVMTFTPFTTADIVSRYIGLVFSHQLTVPSSTWDRLEYERNRLDRIKSRRAGVENPTSFLTYSVMAVDEEAYGRELREDIVRLLPELDGVLPIWSEETSREKEGMFKAKLEALRRARDRELGAQK